MTNDIDSFLNGGGARAAKFVDHGDTVKGTVTASEMRQQTDPESRKPLTWDDGNPRMQLVVTLQTEARDDADDDGTRRLFVKSTAMRQAISDALKAAGTKLEVGGTLAVRYTGDGEKSSPVRSAPKLYAAAYEAPKAQAAAAVGADDLL